MFRFSLRAWVPILVGAIVWVVWLDALRLRHVDYVSQLAAEDAIVDPVSPTGYVDGKRWLIAPEHHNEGYQWITETQQMFARGEWRVRHVDYDHAPSGRTVWRASPYRWWVGLVAWADHVISARPLALSVERAALVADPLLHVLLLMGATIFTARRFGNWPAATLAVGLATLFPFAGSFLPGVLNDDGLAQSCAIASVLLLLAGISARRVTPARDEGESIQDADQPANRRISQYCCFFAGVAGGVGLWVSASDVAPVLGGIALGALVAACLARSRAGEGAGASAWRWWAIGGAATSLLAYVIEYVPVRPNLQLHVNHPLFALAWLGAGEILTRVHQWTRREKAFSGFRDGGILLAALSPLVGLAVMFALNRANQLPIFDPIASRLTNLPNGVVADTATDWVLRDGFPLVVWAAWLPLLLIVPAVWLLVRGKFPTVDRAVLVIAVGPVAVIAGMAWVHLRWWSMLDGMLLNLMVAVTHHLAASATRRAQRLAWAGLTTLVLLPGAIQILVPPLTTRVDELTGLEIEGFIERDLAHWLAGRAGPDGAVVLAPPYRSPGLSFHGGIRSVGSFDPENADGLVAAGRVVGATSIDDVRELILQHSITHIILPSWDRSFDVLASMASARPEQSLLSHLQGEALPYWLLLVPYQPPVFPGTEEHSLLIFEVVEDQDQVVAISRLVEYFIEMEKPAVAASAASALREFPADLSALVAMARLAMAQRNAAQFTAVLESVLAVLVSGYDQGLPWDRRVSLVVVLTHGKRLDLAAKQLHRCLAEMDERRLRSLSTHALFRLQALARALREEIPDPRLRDLALRLLPSELRRQLLEMER